MEITSLRRENVKTIIFRYIHCYNLRRISSVNCGLLLLLYRKNYWTWLSSADA